MGKAIIERGVKMKEKVSSPDQRRENKEVSNSLPSLLPKNPTVKTVLHWRNPRYFSLSIPSRVFPENSSRRNISVLVSANEKILTIELLKDVKR